MDIDKLIDLTRFPIGEQREHKYRVFLARCQKRLARDGSVVLEGFTTKLGTQCLRNEASQWLARAYYCAVSHNCFLTPQDPVFADHHPRNYQLLNNKGGIADDQIPDEADLRKIYDWPMLRCFLADLLGYKALYPMADTLSSLNVNVHQPGQVQGWHFDGAPFAVTLMLQSTIKGGQFEYVPDLRDAHSVNYQSIGAVLNGERANVRTLQIDDGTLVIFKGHHSLHRVSAPEEKSRINAILSFSPRPGVRLDPHTQRTFYGRTSP